MINKTKGYIAFFAASLNIVASALFVDSIFKEFTEPDNVSNALGLWFFAASLMLWATYVVLYFVTSSHKRVKK